MSDNIKKSSTITHSDTAGESHRIYWQQWLGERQSRRQLITSSVLVKLSKEARARNVTDLLKETLQQQTESVGGSLVLVGTLFSLPRDYVQFEHEYELRKGLAETGQFLTSSNTVLTRNHNNATATTNNNELSISARSEPFNVICTLAPTDFPLQIRDKMELQLRHLQQQQSTTPNQQHPRSIISPKLRWFFVSTATSNDVTGINSQQRPNCIDLDGYSTSLEEPEYDRGDWVDDDGDADINNNNIHIDGTTLQATMKSHFHWLDAPSTEDTEVPPKDPSLALSEPSPSSDLPERSLYQQLRYLQTTQQCLSGFLLKQSRHDCNVWRRMHCVITDDYLWFVSRVYHGIQTPRHGRIRLTRSLLLEPTPDYPPLFQTPHSFELVTASGISHVFRATTKLMQAKWIHALSDRIVQSFENSLLQHAGLIIADECTARSRRVTQVAAESLWKTLSQTTESLTNKRAIGAALRWGLDVADYREACRYIQSMLPAKKPVIVSQTATSSERKKRNGNVHGTDTTGNHAPEKVDPHLQEHIRACWTHAAALLARATHTVLQFQPKLSRSIETSCRHVEYVLTGRLRKGQNDLLSAQTLDHRIDPPPIDLFDHLLSELQQQMAQLSSNHSMEESPTGDDTS